MQFVFDSHTMTVNLTTIEHHFHNCHTSTGVLSVTMRPAFVLTLAHETDINRRQFLGVIEEVDTGRELRFRSTEELLEFLAQCFEDAKRREELSEEPSSE
jgi:hypothetical protein